LRPDAAVIPDLRGWPRVAGRELTIPASCRPSARFAHTSGFIPRHAAQCSVLPRAHVMVQCAQLRRRSCTGTSAARPQRHLSGSLPRRTRSRRTGTGISHDLQCDPRHPDDLKTLGLNGEKAYREAYDLVHRREAERPNQIWQADHTQLDLWAKRADGEAARPWLTVIIDDYSRAIDPGNGGAREPAHHQALRSHRGTAHPG
jgi:hypothetical protein